MLSQLPTAERRLVRVICAYRRAREIWRHLWPILAMLAVSGAFWAWGAWLADGITGVSVHQQHNEIAKRAADVVRFGRGGR